MTNAIFLQLLAEDSPTGSSVSFVPALMGIAVLFFFMMYMPEKKKQRQHRAQLEQLKKNDRVVTIGGIYGTVTNVQRDADEVTLKVDEATNTKLRVTFGAISRVVSEEPAGERSDKA